MKKKERKKERKSVHAVNSSTSARVEENSFARDRELNFKLFLFGKEKKTLDRVNRNVARRLRSRPIQFQFHMRFDRRRNHHRRKIILIELIFSFTIYEENYHLKKIPRDRLLCCLHV